MKIRSGSLRQKLTKICVVMLAGFDGKGI